jgi:hypothetical protein
MKGRGSRGLGSHLPLCQRVVLDSNCFDGSPLAELEAIRARGFQLSISIEGLREMWARTLRDEKYEVMRGRIRRVAPLLDAEHPIAFVGTALLSMIGRGPARQMSDDAGYRSTVERGWREICGAGLSVTDWRRIGSLMQQEIEHEERQWVVDAPELLRELRRREVELEASGGPLRLEAYRWSELHGGLGRRHGFTTEPPHAMRAAAFLGFTIARLKESMQRTPDPNDYFDARHLQHLAWPAFLATVDFRLIGAATTACRRQSAWVRTPVELAEDTIARCPPWGRAAEHVAAAFSPATVGERKKRHLAWRDRLTAERAVATVPPTVPAAVQ